MNELKEGCIIEYGLHIGVIIKQNDELYLQYAIHDNKYTSGSDKLNYLDTESMKVIGHIDTDFELLEIDNIDYDDVW